ncbi:hypothetical protein HDU92_002502 [Lobulomyces angularis]|nr:hypothetical protein HDU92_002502 [Lobulomyces angularis]
MMSNNQEPYTTILLAGLALNIEESHLVNVLQKMKFDTKVVIESDSVLNTTYRKIKIIFRFIEDAEKFYATINASQFLGSKVYLSYENTTSSNNFNTTSGAKPLVIKHIPMGCTSMELYEAVRKYGRIISCKVLIDRSGTDCYSLLQYENQDHADQCFMEMNASQFKGSIIYLSWQFQKNSPYIYPTTTASKKYKQQKTSNQNWTNSLPLSPSNTSKINSVAPHMKVPHPGQWHPHQNYNTQNTNVSFQQQGHWKNTLQNSSQSNQLRINTQIESSNHYGNSSPLLTPPPSGFYRNVCDMPINPQVIGSPNLKLDERNLFIKNIDLSFTDQDLANLFLPFGPIVSAKIMRDENSRSKGFGFVSFASQESATAAIQEMQGYRIAGNAKFLVICVAEPKQYRAQKLEAVHFSKRNSLTIPSC